MKIIDRDFTRMDQFHFRIDAKINVSNIDYNNIDLLNETIAKYLDDYQYKNRVRILRYHIDSLEIIPVNRFDSFTIESEDIGVMLYFHFYWSKNFL